MRSINTLVQSSNLMTPSVNVAWTCRSNKHKYSRLFFQIKTIWLLPNTMQSCSNVILAATSTKHTLFGRWLNKFRWILRTASPRRFCGSGSASIINRTGTAAALRIRETNILAMPEMWFLGVWLYEVGLQWAECRPYYAVNGCHLKGLVVENENENKCQTITLMTSSSCDSSAAHFKCIYSFGFNLERIMRPVTFVQKLFWKNIFKSISQWLPYAEQFGFVIIDVKS